MRPAWILPLLLASACQESPSSRGSDSPGATPTPSGTPSPDGEPDYLAELPTGETQRQALCARGGQDRISRWLCDGSGPSITGLDDVLQGLGLKDPADLDAMRFALNGHNVSLAGRLTSSLNPRAVIFTAPGELDYASAAFTRGDGFVEMVGFDPAAGSLSFFLLRYRKGCEPACTPGERFGPANESGWSGVSVYGEADVRNTPLDCVTCHQPGGSSFPRILRQQELQDPWTHWFRFDEPSSVLIDRFESAHPSSETYAGIPVNRIRDARGPEDLEIFVRDGGFGDQPNEFLGEAIQQDGGRGAVWVALYDSAVSGEMIQPPFYDISPFAPEKVDAAASAYRAVVEEGADPSTMPDLSAVALLSDDPRVAADIGFTAGLELDARGVVTHRCGFCHNGAFPGTSRNNFVAADFPDALSAEMKDLVRQRIRESESSRWRMPPTRFTLLTPAQIDAVDAALE